MKPFPFYEFNNFIDKKYFDILIQHLPELKYFKREDDIARAYGQTPHNRYELVYRLNDKNIPNEWHNFIQQLRSRDFYNIYAKLLGVKTFYYQFHWHYARSGDEVSPHTDSYNKFGSHIFYLNSKKNWNLKWGGATLILKAKKGIRLNHAPPLSKFIVIHKQKIFSNKSLFFKKTKNSWHAVSKIEAPKNSLRMIFTVVFYNQEIYENTLTLKYKFKRFFGIEKNVIYPALDSSEL